MDMRLRNEAFIDLSVFATFDYIVRYKNDPNDDVYSVDNPR